MRNKPQEYLTYDWLRKKGVKIVVLTADWYPLNYKISKGKKTYFVVFRDLGMYPRLIIKDMRWGENVYILVYDRHEDKYYLIPSFYFLGHSNGALLFTPRLQKKYFFHPLKLFCEHHKKRVGRASKARSGCVPTLDPHQLSLREFYS